MRVCLDDRKNASRADGFAAFGLTFTVIDPQRADGRLYEWDYEPLDSEGEIVTKSDVAAENVDWS